MIENLVSISVKGPCLITCSKGARLVFYNIHNLHFQNVAILVARQCGLRMTDDRLNNVTSKFETAPYHFQENTTVGVFIINSFDVTFQEVTITEIQGIGLVGVKVLGRVELSDVIFQYNQPADIEECKSCLFP